MLKPYVLISPRQALVLHALAMQDTAVMASLAPVCTPATPLFGDSLHADLNGCLATNCGPHTTCTDKAPPATDGTCSCNTGYSQDDLGTLGCTICTEGYGRNVTSGLCAICPAGKFSGSDANACSTCGVNEFSSAGASFCSTCLAAF